MSSHPALVFNLVTEAPKENYGKKKSFYQVWS
jgi:hypothetical protein